MRVRRALGVEAVDVDEAAELLAGLLRAWRELPFEDGCYVGRDGQRREGLRVVGGRHPVPGVRYRVEVEGELGPEVAHIDLVQADAEWFAILVEVAGGDELRLDLRVEWPDRPGRLQVEASGTTGTPWLTGGRWTMDTTIDRERLPGEPIVARVLHRLAAGSVRVGISPQPDDHWTVTVDLDLRGRGCVRPIAGVLGLMAGRPVGRALEESLENVPDAVRALNQELARVEAEGMDTAARRLLREQLDLALA